MRTSSPIKVADRPFVHEKITVGVSCCRDRLSGLASPQVGNDSSGDAVVERSPSREWRERFGERLDQRFEPGGTAAYVGGIQLCGWQMLPLIVVPFNLPRRQIWRSRYCDCARFGQLAFRCCYLTPPAVKTGEYAALEDQHREQETVTNTGRHDAAVRRIEAGRTGETC